MNCVKCKSQIDDDSLYCKHCGKKQEKTKGPKRLKRANGTGTVYKLSGRRNKPWVAALNKTIIGCYAEKNAALDALQAVCQSGITDQFNATIEDIYNRWKGLHFRDLEEKGIAGYETAWKRLEPIKDKKMREIKSVDFQSIIDEAMTISKNPKPLSRSGKEKIKQLCSQLCKQAIKDELILRNYGEYIKLDKSETKEKEIFSFDEIEILFQNDSETARIILTLIYTGFRINELFGLKVEDVKCRDLPIGVYGPAAFSHFVGGEKTDAGKNRIVPIHSKILPFVSQWITNGNLYLVATTTGSMMSDINFRARKYYPLLESLGIKKKNPHCTRHTFSTMMAKAGARPEVLQKILGHTDFSTTANIYIHSDVNALSKEMKKI